MPLKEYKKRFHNRSNYHTDFVAYRNQVIAKNNLNIIKVGKRALHFVQNLRDLFIYERNI